MYDISRIGIVIKKHRTENRKSQETLSEVVDITPTHLKHIESGHRKPSVEVLFDIFNELNISFDELSVEENSEQEMRIKINKLLNKCEKKRLDLIYKIIKAIIE